jgi:hypothetical protein
MMNRVAPSLRSIAVAALLSGCGDLVHDLPASSLASHAEPTPMRAIVDRADDVVLTLPGEESKNALLHALADAIAAGDAALSSPSLTNEPPPSWTPPPSPSPPAPILPPPCINVGGVQICGNVGVGGLPGGIAEIREALDNPKLVKPYVESARITATIRF